MFLYNRDSMVPYLMSSGNNRRWSIRKTEDIFTWLKVDTLLGNEVKVKNIKPTPTRIGVLVSIYTISGLIGRTHNAHPLGLSLYPGVRS